MLRIIAWIVFFTIFLITILLTIPNAHIVKLNYYVGSLEIHLTVLLMVTLFVGVLLGIFFNLMWVWNLYRENQRLKKLHKQALREVHLLLTPQDTSKS